MKRLIASLLTLIVAVALRGASPEFASLPEYKPSRQVTGVIRSWGNPHMAGLMKNWEEGFKKYQPGIFFIDNLKSTAMAPFGLFESVADLAVMGRRIYTYEYYGVYRRSLMLPVEIAVATGSYNVPHKSFALTVFVHRDNPVSQLTLAQLDGIFGAERLGGWQGLKWNRGSARGVKTNLRTWGQLGLTGEWATKPIHLYGPPGIYPGGTSFFQSRVMGGADTWAEGLQEFEDRGKMMEALSHDPLGIAYTGVCYQTPQTKPVALAEGEGTPFVLPTRETVANRTYPLSRLVYLSFAPDQPGGDVTDPKADPKVEEFLRYILSRQGQEDVAREGDYLPLTAAMITEQLALLNNPSAAQPK